mmetsp:Transcript_35533/g.113555  ORF Transcript_35533/g.113555 Transcript_35533/m.113555 type:complete len:355 (+) Transcript_35533:512-1576(+)
METDLHAVIRADLLEDVHKRYVSYQLLKALKYVHSAGVVHRDVKPSNMLLNENCHMKLCDFGLCRSAGDDGAEKTNHRQKKALAQYDVATRWYRAPEILLGSALCLPGLDLWATACIIGEMYQGSPVLPGDSTDDQIRKILSLVDSTGTPDNDPTATLALLVERRRANEEEDDHHRALNEDQESSSRSNPPDHDDDDDDDENCDDYDSSSSDGGRCRQKKSGLASWFLRECVEARPLCAGMLRLDPRSRVTAARALSDDWLAAFRGTEHEPSFGKPKVQLNIADDERLTAAQYRDHLFVDLLKHKKKPPRPRNPLLGDHLEGDDDDNDGNPSTTPATGGGPSTPPMSQHRGGAA